MILLKNKGIRTRREKSVRISEKNSPVDCFCRRGQAACGAIGALRRKIPSSGPKNKALLRKGFIFIQSEGLVCNRRQAYVIRLLGKRYVIKPIGLYVSFLRIDYIHFFEMLTYRNKLRIKLRLAANCNLSVNSCKAHGQRAKRGDRRVATENPLKQVRKNLYVKTERFFGCICLFTKLFF